LVLLMVVWCVRVLEVIGFCGEGGWTEG